MSESQSSWRTRWDRKRGSMFVIGAILLGVIGWSQWGGRSSVSRGIFIGDVALGGLEWSEAPLQIESYLQRRFRQPLAFTGDAGLCSLVLESIGAKLDLSASVAELRRLSEARRGWRDWFRERSVLRPRLIWDEARFDAWLVGCEARAVKERPVAGRLVAKDVDFTIQPSRAGRVVDRKRVFDVVPEMLSRTDDAAEALDMIDQPEIPTLAELERQRAVAIELVSKPVVMHAEKARLTLLRVDLAKMLDWQVQADRSLAWHLSRAKFDQWIGSRRHRVEQRAREATYEVKERDKLVVVPEQAGSLIAVDRLFSLLEQSLREGKHQLDIPFEPTELPKRHVADLDKLNIHEPVGSFTTRHACCQPRVNNIHRIADLVNGVIVAPGETFSLNEHVGQRSLENGFVPAPSIEDGEMVDTIGGGVSQFATTYYNAMLRSGYEVLERQAHTYWFDRYPMGHEATLSWPKPDVVIRNDTQSGLLILTSYTDRSITVRLFGDREGRHVDVSVSPRFDIVRNGVEYLPNPDVEPEKERIKEPGCVGWSVWTMRTVKLRDGTTKQDKRKVIYKPRLRRVEVHPCRIPEGEPGYTGEKCPEPTADETDRDAGSAGE